MKAAVGFVCSCTAVYYLQLCANSKKPFFSPSDQALASSAFDCTQELPPAARQPGFGYRARSDHSNENPQEAISRAQLRVCVCKKQERATKCMWENLGQLSGFGCLLVTAWVKQMTTESPQNSEQQMCDLLSGSARTVTRASFASRSAPKTHFSAETKYNIKALNGNAALSG